MVTNFIDIPEQKKPTEEDEEGQMQRNSSYVYSNVGTFQTPERGHSNQLSPNNQMLRDVIMENNADEEEDMTPDSAERPASKTN